MSSRRYFLKNSVGFLVFSSLSFHISNTIDAKLIKPTPKPRTFLDNLESKIETPDTLYLYGYNRKIDFDLDIQKNLVIVCHELILASKIKTNGFSITILVNTLKTDSEIDDIILDTSGNSYEDDKPMKAITPDTTLGTKGPDGDDKLAKSGGNGGNIEIYAQFLTGYYSLDLSGGNGGAGQDGGDSIQGLTGSAGGEKQAGSAGKKGPDGGKGGNGGNGGNGGQLNICVFDQKFKYNDNTTSNLEEVTTFGGMSATRTKSNWFKVFVRGGKPGEQGIGGAGGPGGNGGPGGGYWQKSGRSGIEGEPPVWKPNTYPQGPSGPAGLKGDDGKPGKRGKNGSNSFHVLKTAQFADMLYQHPIFSDILNIQLDNLFIEEQLSDLAKALNWYSEIFKNFSKQQSANTRWINTISKQIAFQSSLNMGLDYWGNGALSVSLLNIEQINPRLDQYFSGANEFEKIYNTFVLEQEDAVAKQALAREALKIAKNLLNEKRIELNTLAGECNELNTQTTILSNEIHKIENQLLNDERDFRIAVEKELVGCSLERVIQFTKMAVNIGRAVNGDVTAIMGSLDDVSDVFARNYDKDYIQNVVKKAKVIGSSIETTGDSVADLRLQYQRLEALMNPTSDLYIIQDGDYKTLLEKFGHMKEAAALRADYDNYLGVCDVRNKRRIEFTKKLAEHFQLSKSILTLEETLTDKSISVVTATSNIMSERTQILMDSLYYNLRIDALSIISIQNRAYQFWSLEDNTLPKLSISSLGAIYAQHLNVTSRILQTLNSKGHSRTSGYLKGAYIISKSKNALEFDRLLKVEGENNSLVFNLTPENSNFNIIDNCEIYAQSVEVFISNAKSKDSKLRLKLIHHGNSTFVNAKMKKLEYLHKQIGASMTWNINDEKFENQITENNLTGDSSFLGVSPFATWTLLIRNQGLLDLKDVDQIQVDFKYKYYTNV